MKFAPCKLVAVSAREWNDTARWGGQPRRSNVVHSPALAATKTPGTHGQPVILSSK
jgi:hypothetical protein